MYIPLRSIMTVLDYTPQQPKKIAIHIPSEISQPPLQQGYVSTILPSPHPEQTDIMFTTITTTQTVPGGKLTRVEQNSTVVSPYGQLESGMEYGGRLLESGVEYGNVEEEPEEMEEFISLAELEANRLPDSGKPGVTSPVTLREKPL